MVMFQWLQVSTRVFQADVLDVSIDDVAIRSVKGLDATTWLSFGAVIALAVGLRLGAGRPRRPSHDIPAEVSELSIMNVFGGYLVLLFVGQFLEAYAWRFYGLTQIALALASLKVVPLALLAFMVLAQRRGLRLLVIAVLIEVALGLSGYFADFKPTFYILLIVASSAQLRLSRRQLAGGAVVAAALVALSLFWTAIKTDYRRLLNQGTEQQAVLASWSARFHFMREAAARTDLSDIAGAIRPAADRLGAADYFAATVSYVPRVVPHTDGELWMGALRHTLMPRILFPNKPVLINDSRITRQYTGLAVAGEERGTSIGIGYVAESYVDFGRWGMWFPILGLGLLWGWMYRKLLRWATHRVIAFAVAMACLLPVMFFETSSAKQLGSGLSRFMVLAFVVVISERRAWNWMRLRRKGRRPLMTEPRPISSG
jgi:hypothetical protein